ncbi:MAG: GldM family protein [Bacteroidales bacterium]|jgi:gliding motility-associated protein GldM
MAGYKETPRQKMISMMYLVLTALLALNVSKEILDAFLVVNKSMETTNESVAAKIDEAYAKFQAQYTLNKAKVGPFWEKAQQMQAEAEDLLEYLEHLKFKLVLVAERNKDSLEIVNLYYSDSIIRGENRPILNLHLVPSKDKYNETTNFMVHTPTKGEAFVLAERMDTFRSTVLSVMGLPMNSEKIGLVTSGVYPNADGAKQNWEMHNFYHTILAADITIINKIIAEVRSAQFNALNYLYSQVSEKDFKFDNVKAEVIPTSTYIFKGQKYEARVLVAAYDSKTDLESRVLQGVDEITDANQNRTTTIKGEGGIINLEFPTNTEGVQRYAGQIIMREPGTGEIKTYPYQGEYIVAPPALTVAPLKMNVFYIGVDNPVSISAPGLAQELIRPVISTGILKKDPKSKDWIVRIDKKPTGKSLATVSATAEIDGKVLQLGTSEFRVKRVPDPIAEIAGQTGGSIDKNILLSAGAIIPNMEDFNFDLYFIVTSYTFGTIVNGDYLPKNIKGNQFTPEVISLIKNGKSKQKFFFDNIQSQGPDGTIRPLNPVNLELK